MRHPEDFEEVGFVQSLRDESGTPKNRWNRGSLCCLGSYLSFSMIFLPDFPTWNYSFS